MHAVKNCLFLHFITFYCKSLKNTCVVSLMAKKLCLCAQKQFFFAVVVFPHKMITVSNVFSKLKGCKPFL